MEERMSRRKAPEQIISKLREAEFALAQGETVGRFVAVLVERIRSTKQSYYHWRKEYGGLKMDQARRLKHLEKENGRLRKAVSDLILLDIPRPTSGGYHREVPARRS
jgi:hypothetical protein